jgi:3-hydroxybutyryl-CoA dehydrogenase
MTTVGILGAGIMGAGIAQVAATHGCLVQLLDVEEDLLRRAINGITDRLGRLVQKGTLTAEEFYRITSRIGTTTQPAHLDRCDLVIEAVTEKLAIKVQILETVKQWVGPETIFASNTSSLSITTIGRALGESRRLVGMHFFTPAPLMPLVEVIAGADSDPAVVEQVAALARSWDKTVVRAKDTPGFIVNRVARGYYLESLRLLGEGVASLDEIDRTMKQLGGFRLGPFELMDLVGIDVNYSVTCSVWEQLGRPTRMTPHPIQADLYQRGQLGRKTKRGFYDYATDPPAPAVSVERRPLELPEVVCAAVQSFTERATSQPRTEAENYIYARVLVTVLNEAALLLDEGVASREDIDTAMRLGTNYPRGPLEWTDAIGSAVCGKMLWALNATVQDDRFRPVKSLGG